MTNRELVPHAPRSVLAASAAIACGAVLALVALCVELTTFATQDYTPILAVAIGCASVSLLVLAFGGRRARWVGRGVVLVFALVDVAVVADAVRRLLALAR